MVDGVETEWQFDAGDLELVRGWIESQPRHAPLVFDEVRDREQVDSYYDTADWRLYHAGFSLRRRRTGESYELTLKGLAPTVAGPIARREVTEVSSDGEVPGAAGPVSDRVRAIVGRRELVRLFEVRTRRRTYAASRSGEGRERVAVVELDETTIAPPTAPVTTFCRVEVELAEGGAAAEVEPFIAAMALAGSLTPTSAAKFEAGLRAAALDPEAALDFGSTKRERVTSASEFAFNCLRAQWASFLRHEPGTRLGEDIEALHQMRVATRRLRATIRLFDSVLPDEFERLRDELQWVGHELGAVRDLDVQIERLQALRDAADWDGAAALTPLIEVVEADRRVERLRLLELLNTARYDDLVERMSAVLRGGPGDEARFADVRVYAAPILEQRFGRVRRDGRRLTAESPPAEYHALRIRAKRLRYSLELFGELYGRSADEVVVAVKALQDLLGDHQDAEVGIERLRSIVARSGAALSPQTLVAIGQLIERYGRQMETLRRGYPEAFGALQRRWRRLTPAITTARERARRAAAVAAAREVAIPHAEDAEAAGEPPSTPPVTPASPTRPAGLSTAGEASAATTSPPTGQPSAQPPTEPELTSSTPTPPRTLGSGLETGPAVPADPGALSRMRHLFQRD